jgi:hypothetical protein
MLISHLIGDTGWRVGRTAALEDPANTGTSDGGLFDRYDPAAVFILILDSVSKGGLIAD